jgi:hypothetical protein
VLVACAGALSQALGWLEPLSQAIG